MFLLLLPVLVLGIARAEEKLSPSTYTHTAPFQHRGTLWLADGVLQDSARTALPGSGVPENKDAAELAYGCSLFF